MFLICLFEQYYVRVNKNNWDEIYNPNYATVFESKKQANKWVNENTTFSESAKVVPLEETCVKYNEWEKNGSVRRSFDLVDNNISRPYNNESPEEVLNWRLKVKESEVRYEDFRTWPQLYSLFKHIHSICEYYSQDFLGKYISFQLFFKLNSKFEEFEKEFNLIVEKATYKEKDGYKIFPIFDHHLSEGGDSVCLFYKTDKDCYVKGRYVHVVKGSLEHCFEYLKKERFYDC